MLTVPPDALDAAAPFDAADGAVDGRASVWRDLRALCGIGAGADLSGMTTPQLLDALRPLWQAGQCPAPLLVGVVAQARTV